MDIFFRMFFLIQKFMAYMQLSVLIALDTRRWLKFD